MFEYFKYLALLTQVGLVMVLPIVGGFYIGRILVEKYGLFQSFPIILAVLGVMSGFYSAYRLITKT